MTKTVEAELGFKTKAEAVVAALGSLAGLRVIDVGCGEGVIARALAAEGAHVSGYDPYLEAVERGPVDVGSGSWRLATAAADAVPEPDGSADVVLFVFSLHHVPHAKLASSLQDARRLLKPSGRLCVMEPLAEGPSQYIMELYHDETAVRRAAANALAAYARPLFDKERVLYYEELRVFQDFDGFAQQAIAGMRYNGYTEAEVLAPEVRRRFAEIAATHGGRLEQPVRINVFG